MPNIVTANDLRSGSVVYLGPGGIWLDAIGSASVAEDSAALQILEAQAAASVARCEVIAVYAFAVSLHGGKPEPVSMRERIRATHAPTV
jgi:hypothetical protein